MSKEEMKKRDKVERGIKGILECDFDFDDSEWVLYGI